MDKPLLTTHDIARMVNADISTVSTWIDQKKLAAFRTPGGHRRVRREDFRAFLETYKMPFPPTASRTGLTVLVVEDDPDFRRAVKRLIESVPGVTAHEAEDGFTAGRRVEDLKPDLVLLDLMLPGVDGIKVCRQIRRDPDLSGTRVIVISGHDSPENRRLVLEAGADAFLSKPLGLPRLKDLILSFLTQSASARRD